jgi:steroid delta-isomerase-like uncharacterized protein
MSLRTFSQTQSQIRQTEAVKALPRLYLEEVVNKQRLELLPQIFAKDFVAHEMNGKDNYHMQNNTLEPFLVLLFKAFPDLHYTIENIIAEGDKVAVNCTATGTNKGDFFGSPATGNKVTYKEIFIYRVSNNKIVEAWVVVDLAGVKDQLSKK